MSDLHVITKRFIDIRETNVNPEATQALIEKYLPTDAADDMMVRIQSKMSELGHDRVDLLTILTGEYNTSVTAEIKRCLVVHLWDRFITPETCTVEQLAKAMVHYVLCTAYDDDDEAGEAPFREEVMLCTATRLVGLGICQRAGSMGQFVRVRRANLARLLTNWEGKPLLKACEEMIQLEIQL